MSFRYSAIVFLSAALLCVQPVKAQYFDFKRIDTTQVIHNGTPLSKAWLGGMNFCQFSKVDMDLDGIKDLLVFDRSGNVIMPFINQGGAGLNYTYAAQYANYFPAGINSWMLMVDYNCDNKEDIFTYYPGGMSIYRNISDTILKFELVVQPLRSSQLGNYLNLLVTSVDIPAICDIDGDGDKDVINFGQFGKLIEYHRNYSVEFGYGCDSLPFVMKNECWGNFYESSVSCSMTLFDTCEVNPFLGGPPELAPTPAEYRAWFSEDAPGADIINDGAERHTGSSLLALDLNGANTKELIIGDVSCNHLSALYNGGTVPNTNTSMISCDSLFPSYSVPVDISVFPAAFHLDMDNDGIRDLVVGTNYTDQANNYDGNWYYKNTGTELTPIFTYQQHALFQADMIEHGEGSVPVFFDHNGDGLKDLIIANRGIWDVTHFTYDRYVSQMRLYLNTGTATQPEFTLTDTNYQNTFQVHDTVSLLPAFGDLNGDGDMDMIMGDVDGRLHKYQNTAGAGNPAVFSIQQTNMTNDVGAVIDVGWNAAPHLADMDRDGDLDLLIGKNDGRVSYYSNVGSPTSPSFKFITATFGNVNACEWWSTIGYSTPYVYDNNGEYVLFVGSLRGKVLQYDSIDGNLMGTFNLRDSLPDPYSYFGVSTAPAVADLNGDTLPEMVVGNFRGGLVMYTSTALDTTGNTISELPTVAQLEIFPNPATNVVNIKTDLKGRKSVGIYAIDGRKIEEHTFSGASTQLNIASLPNGVYLLSLRDSTNQGIQKNVRLVKR